MTFYVHSGYMAPEYAFNGLFSIKSDIFSFGIMVLEIVSGKRCSAFRPENDSLTLTGHVSAKRPDFLFRLFLSVSICNTSIKGKIALYKCERS